MASILSQQNINFHFLYRLKQELNVYLNREQICLTSQQFTINNSQSINQRFEEENQIIKVLSFKLINFIDFCFKIKEEYEESINDLNDQMQIKDGTLYNLQEANAHLEEKIQLYALEYQKLKGQIIIMSEKIEKQENQYMNETRRLTNSLKEAEEGTEKDKYTISTVINEKKILFDQIKNQRSIPYLYQEINADLSNQLHQNKIKTEEQLKLQKYYEGRMLQMVKGHKELQRLIEQKTMMIDKLQNDSKGYKEYVMDKNNLDQNYLNTRPDADQTIQNRVHKLSFYEQSPFSEQPAKAFCRNLSELSLYTLKTFPKGNNEQDYKSTYKMVLDPYYAHFVLTSQSVKIREDCETLLNIDVKPFYKQIIQKRIPMHLWDQWIRNKLKQILKQMKTSKPQQLDEDYQE